MSRNDFYLNEWAGEFGNKYTERCNVDSTKRVPIFKNILFDILSKYSSPQVLEVGCNKGHNLEAIKFGRGSNFGIEPNKSLCNKPNIINGNAYDLPWSDKTFDLVFTSGVLIHIPKEKLELALSEMDRVSNRYVLMIEYPAPEERGRKYMDFGEKEGVWSRPYGKIFQRQFPESRLIKYGSVSDFGYSDDFAFSKDCDYWLFEKK